jgi:hypothetical protein
MGGGAPQRAPCPRPGNSNRVRSWPSSAAVQHRMTRGLMPGSGRSTASEGKPGTGYAFADSCVSRRLNLFTNPRFFEQLYGHKSARRVP